VHLGGSILRKNSATPLRLPFQYGATPVDLVILSECNACGMSRKEPAPNPRQTIGKGGRRKWTVIGGKSTGMPWLVCDRLSIVSYDLLGF
jgi:hypothetical protein